MQKNFLAVIDWLSLDLVVKRTGTPHTIANQNGCWNRQPIFRYNSALEKEAKEEEGKQYISQQVMTMFSLLLKMVISVNQLSLHGAVADLIIDMSDDQRAPGKPVALDQVEPEIITQLPHSEIKANDERQRIVLQDHERRSEKKHQKTRRYPNCAP